MYVCIYVFAIDHNPIIYIYTSLLKAVLIKINVACAVKYIKITKYTNLVCH